MRSKETAKSDEANMVIAGWRMEIGRLGEGRVKNATEKYSL